MGRRLSRGVLLLGLAVLLLAGCNAGVLKDLITELATLVYWREAAKLDAGPARSLNDWFGNSVAASGDDIVVGCQHDDPVSNAGSVHFFHWDGSQWQHQRYDGTVVNQRLGYAVAISGDYAIAGAPALVGTAGSARLFKRTAGTWALEKTLTPSGSPNTAVDEFGTSVAISGDYALVGAPANDGGVRGHAYVYYRNHITPDSWGQQAQLQASDGGGPDNFGTSVALSDPYAVVGAPSLETAYLFTRSGGSWGTGTLPSAETLQLEPSDGLAGDLFGTSVAVIQTHALVGAAIGEAAYLYERDGAAWGSGTSPATESVKLLAAGGVAGDQFGGSVALTAGWAAVGAVGRDDSGSNAGAVYVFAESEGWAQFGDALLPAGLAAADQFGIATSLASGWLVAGANLDDEGLDADVGAAYVFALTQRK